jgi:hypothetical protein
MISRYRMVSTPAMPPIEPAMKSLSSMPIHTVPCIKVKKLSITLNFGG